MKIRIVAVGKLKEPALFDLLQNYLRRIQPLCPLRLEEVKDFPIRKGTSTSVALNLEAEFIKERLSDDSFYIVLDVKGKQKSSEDLSALLQRLENENRKEVVFILGGPFGVSEELLRGARERLSLSKMTFPHELARVILVEQLYRAYTILKKVPYHHA
ncbi:MAG: 23S rRNA (pseudouridine(1915)-N(3))-methyltransferase RlmH [Deltaproteobacteria bacterium]|nr:23S rRNA (pseudouridine(1915)-N(3))-methyltransferase RlmH [Deltaproteobacteria bacterium]